ncbi:MAG TPA: glutathione S-transferase family protein [Thermohalobaculum sp.]|nr:glutathione S-transferase family protein [Thermohalobaculum sp.]
MELFTTRTCPYAHRTRIALLEKGLDCEHVEIDLGDKPARFLAVSPYGKVPALVHDGHTIYESLIANEYLDEVFPDPPLMPTDPALRAKARIWGHFCDNYYVTDTSSLVRTRDPAERRRLVAQVQDRMRFMETEGLAKLSGDGPYWFGARVSLADIAFYPFFERLPALAHWRGLSIPDDCPRLKAWLAAMQARESVRKIAHDGAFYVKLYTARAGEVIAA